MVLQLGFVNPNLNYIWSNGDNSVKQFSLNVKFTLNNSTVTNLITPASVNNLVINKIIFLKIYYCFKIQIACSTSSNDISFAGIQFSSSKFDFNTSGSSDSFIVSFKYRIWISIYYCFNNRILYLLFSILKTGQAPNIRCSGNGTLPSQLINGLNVNQINVLTTVSQYAFHFYKFFLKVTNLFYLEF